MNNCDWAFAAINEKKLVALLGMAQKAGKVASGEFAVDKAVKSGKSKLILIATDVSENTRKGYKDMSGYYKVPCYEVLPKQQLGLCIGKDRRAALAILDQGFAKAILGIILE